MLRLQTIILTTMLVFFIFIAAYFLYLRRNFNYWSKRNIIGPKPQSLTAGTLPKTFAGKCNLIEELHEIYLQYKKSQKFVGIYSGVKPCIFILDPKLATEVLKQKFSSFHDNESSNWTSYKVEQLRPHSPFVSRGNDWKISRYLAVPLLTRRRLRTFYPILRDSAAKLTAYLESHQDVNFFDAKELSTRFTSHFMSNYIWGIEADAFEHTKLSNIHQMAKAMISQALHCVHCYYNTTAWPLLRKLRPVRFFPKHTDSYFIDLTKSVSKLRAMQPVNRGDVMDHLIKVRTQTNSLSDIQMAAQTTTLLLDGFETGAVVISHFFLLLSRNPRVQAKLRQELLDYDKQELTFEKLHELSYLDQCLQETLRLFPPLAALFKLCTKPITLYNNDAQSSVSLKKNEVIYISSYSFHRDAEFYENPEEFWPERFDAEFGGLRKYQDMGVFLPFGDGPRTCIGMKLALAEIKTAVSEIVRHFQINCSSCTRKDNQIAANSFLLGLDGDIKLSFKKLADTF